MLKEFAALLAEQASNCNNAYTVTLLVDQPQTTHGRYSCPYASERGKHSGIR